jgi:RND family efflux transporter MFP subunit
MDNQLGNQADHQADHQALFDVDQPEETSGKKSHLGPIIVVGGIGLIVTGIFSLGIIPRLQNQSELNAFAKSVVNSVPTVNVVQPELAAASTSIVLPGTVQAYTEATIFSRTNGYLKQRFVDIGDRVNARQVLTTISTPDTDQDVHQSFADLAKAEATLAQGRADLVQRESSVSQAKANLVAAQAQLVQAQVNLELARKTWLRWQALEKQGAVTKQAADQDETAYYAGIANVQTVKAQLVAAQDNVKTAVAAVTSQQANINSLVASVASSKANHKRMRVVQSFKRILAPFTGIITARNVDTGDLISVGTDSNTNNAWLFKIAETDTLRIHINVPQNSVQSIHAGELAQVHVRELPARTFTGTVVRTANSLDASTNTLLTEVVVQNSDNVLRPGMYAEVTFTANRSNPPLLVPANTLVINALGTQVATVTPDRKVHFQKVALGRDYGKNVEVTSDLSKDTVLIANPTNDLVEGRKVKVLANKSEES